MTKINLISSLNRGLINNFSKSLIKNNLVKAAYQPSYRLFSSNCILKAEEIQLTQDRIVQNLSEELKAEREASSEFEEPKAPNGFQLNKWDGVGIVELQKVTKKGQIIIQFHINDINLTENDLDLSDEASEFLGEIDYDDGTVIEASVLLVKPGKSQKLLFDLEIFQDTFGIDQITSVPNLELKRSALGPYDFEHKLDYNHSYSEPFFEMAEVSHTS
jgi:hypothetical protein